jgi:hypothetical protein
MYHHLWWPVLTDWSSQTHCHYSLIFLGLETIDMKVSSLASSKKRWAWVEEHHMGESLGEEGERSQRVINHPNTNISNS